MGFFDGGGKAVKFDNVNEGASGYIVAQIDPRTGAQVPYTESQQTDYTTKEPKTYKDGNPIMQAVVLLQTEDRADDDDDGQRTLYVNKTRMKRAIQKALKEAINPATGQPGVGDLQIGGVLTIWMTGTEASQGGGSPAKTFQASYSPPVGSLAASSPAPSAPPAAAPPAPVAAAPVAPPVAAAPPAPVAAPSAPPAPPAPVAPPAPAAPPVAPPSAPPAPAAAPVAAAPVSGSESDLPF